MDAGRPIRDAKMNRCFVLDKERLRVTNSTGQVPRYRNTIRAMPIEGDDGCEEYAARLALFRNLLERRGSKTNIPETLRFTKPTKETIV